MAMIAAYFYISGSQRAIMGGFEAQPVVVARENILANTALLTSMLEIRMIPKPYIQPQAIQSIEAAEGYVATANIFRGEQILDTKLSKPSERAVSLVLPREQRAFTLAVNEITGVAGLVRPGDRIDIIGTFQTTDQATRLTAKSKTVMVMQNVEVLAVGRNYTQESLGQSGSRSNTPNDILAAQANKRTQFSNITVSVSPRQAMDLALAQQIGVLSLALRSYYDRPGTSTPNLKSDPSTANGVTGIADPIKAGNLPRWLEMRGEQSMVVP